MAKLKVLQKKLSILFHRKPKQKKIQGPHKQQQRNHTFNLIGAPDRSIGVMSFAGVFAQITGFNILKVFHRKLSVLFQKKTEQKEIQGDHNQKQRNHTLKLKNSSIGFTSSAFVVA